MKGKRSSYSSSSRCTRGNRLRGEVGSACRNDEAESLTGPCFHIIWGGAIHDF